MIKSILLTNPLRAFRIFSEKPWLILVVIGLLLLYFFITKKMKKQ